MSARGYRLTDAEVSDLIRDERKYNEYLRKRRAASVANGDPLDVLLCYDDLISSSDRRMIDMYAKNRRCCSTDGER